MGFGLNGGTLYMMNPNGEQFILGNDLCGDIEIDTLSPDEIPDVFYNLKDMASATLEMSLEDLNFLDGIAFKQPTPTDAFNIEHDVPILVQARWHKKKRINKKWLKRYGMKKDTVKIKAIARTMSHMTETGEFNIEVDKLEYMWRPDQKRKYLKIEM